MPVPRLLTDAQHKRYYDLYMKEARSPAECVPILEDEFRDQGLKVTSAQLSSYAYERDWTKRKKALKGKAEAKASRIVNVMAANIAKQKLAVQEQHKSFLEKSATIGAKVLERAEKIIDSTGSARDLSSAANAAAKGIEIYRKAVGLDEGSGGSLAGAGNTFVFNFARSEGSPFAKSAVETTVTEVDAGEHEAEPGEPASEEPLASCKMHDATPDDQHAIATAPADQGTQAPTNQGHT